jgi:hypothetical protein
MYLKGIIRNEKESESKAVFKEENHATFKLSIAMPNT